MTARVGGLGLEVLYRDASPADSLRFAYLDRRRRHIETGPAPTGIPLALTNAGFSTLTATFTGGSVSIDWGDGSPIEQLASGVQKSHAYTSFTGSAVLLPRGFLTGPTITGLDVSTGAWSFTLEDIGTYFPDLLSLNAGTGAGNSISGNLAALPEGLTFYQVFGSNTTTGDIGDLPSTVTDYRNGGLNTTFGDLAGLHEGLLRFQNGGLNTTTGDIGDLPAGLTYYLNHGSNTSSGGVDDLPVGVTLYSNVGLNTTSGDIAGLPSTLTYYQSFGSNTTFGDIGSLPAGLTRYENLGLNTTTGDLAGLPAGVTLFRVFGLNTTTGDIGDLPAGVTFYQNLGLNSTFGDLADLPAGLGYYGNFSTGVISYTAGRNWASLNRAVISATSSSLTTAEVDSLLIDMSATAPTVGIEKVIELVGLNQSRSIASDAAVADLQSRGWTVTVNDLGPVWFDEDGAEAWELETGITDWELE